MLHPEFVSSALQGWRDLPGLRQGPLPQWEVSSETHAKLDKGRDERIGWQECEPKEGLQELIKRSKETAGLKTKGPANEA